VAEFYKLGTVEEVGPGEIQQYLVENRFVALCNVEGEFHAFEDICTHQFTHLSEGEFTGSEVKCPLHGAKFDVKTGAAKSLPAVKPVPKHEVKVENGNVYVALNPKRVKVSGRRGLRR
jgi:3-phenylpropionate/trans-cinnamate dioxygenase ferredoxin component